MNDNLHQFSLDFASRKLPFYYTYDPFACSVTDFGLKLKSEDDLTTTGKRRKNRELKQKKLLS